MKNHITFFVMSIIVLMLGTQTIQAQVSHQTGFYAQDSLFFESLYQPQPGEQILISVNQFTDEGFVPYTGGVWLYNRNFTQNTWEDQQLTRYGYFSWQSVDTLAPRGPLRKVNVVRIRIISDTASVDSVYFVGVSGSDEEQLFPYTIPVAFLFIDSLDAFGPYGFYGPGAGIPQMYLDENNQVQVVQEDTRIWNYDITDGPARGVYKERRQKPALVHIIDPLSNETFLLQNVGARISAGSSRFLSNRTIMICAEKEYEKSRIETRLFSDDPKLQKWETIRFRVGGNIPRSHFGSNEIGLGIMQGTKMGGVPYRPVILYLNGSFWTMAFAQPKMDNHTVGKMYKDASKDSVTLATAYTLFPFWGEPDTSYLPYDQIIETFHEHMPDLGFDRESVKELFNFEETRLNAYITEGSNTFRIGIAELRSGKDVLRFNDAVQPIINTLVDTLNEESIYDRLSLVLSVDKFLLYLVPVNYFTLDDHITNNVYMAHINGRKPFLVMSDFDGATFIQFPDFWEFMHDQIFSDQIQEKLPFIVLGSLLSSQKGIDRLALIYQDHLNTTFRPERTTAIIQDLYQQIVPHYWEHYLSWAPANSGPEPETLDMMFANAQQFALNRPDESAQQLVDFWFPDDSMTLDDRNLVRVVFDSIPGGLARVKLNSLKIKSNFTGVYFPKPALEIDLRVEDGYQIHFREYPDSGSTFSIFADTAITLTPVFRVRPNPLPIELALFSCSVKKGQPFLEWTTLSELNSKEFIIERSFDGVDFTQVGRVQSIGGDEETSYEFVDNNVPPGVVYYRIRQVDWDGTYWFSDICVITDERGEVHPFVYPNPTKDQIQFSRKFSGEIRNIFGVVVRKFDLTQVVNVSDFPSGAYIVSFDGISDPIKFLKE